MPRVAYTRENIDKCWCGSCPVWSENGLASNHYCLSGSAEQTGR